MTPKVEGPLPGLRATLGSKVMVHVTWYFYNFKYLSKEILFFKTTLLVFCFWGVCVCARVCRIWNEGALASGSDTPGFPGACPRPDRSWREFPAPSAVLSQAGGSVVSGLGFAPRPARLEPVVGVGVERQGGPHVSGAC